MTGHPAWCAGPPVCTAAPVPGLAFSEGEHRSKTVELPTASIVWPLAAGVLTAHLTEHPVCTWPTATHLHINSERHGPLAQMPVSSYRALTARLDQIVGLVEPEPAKPAQAERPVVHCRYPLVPQHRPHLPGDSDD